MGISYGTISFASKLTPIFDFLRARGQSRQSVPKDSSVKEESMTSTI